MNDNVSIEMKSTAMEYWRHIKEWATNPPVDDKDWQYAKLALGVMKTFVSQQAVENNREAIKLTTAQFLKGNSSANLQKALQEQSL